MSDELELLLSGLPDIKNQFSELKNRVLANGPLDLRSRMLAVTAVAVATRHPSLSDVLIQAKQAGIRNEEISHLAAISAILAAGRLGAAASAGDGQQPSTVATCC